MDLSSAGRNFLEDSEMAVRTFTAALHKGEDVYVAQCPEGGRGRQGDTAEEAVAPLKEARELSLEESLNTP